MPAGSGRARSRAADLPGCLFAFANLERTDLTACFHASVTGGFYTAGRVNFWTAAPIASFGVAGALASPL